MDVDEQIVDLGMAGDLAAALRRVASARAVEVEREAGYVSVRPVGRHIAAYFNRQLVDIAVEPLKSAGVAVRHPGTTVLQKTNATHYLRVPTGAVDEDKIVELVTEALDWREIGNRWSGRQAPGGAADLAGETCAACFLVIANNGTCGCD